MRRIGEVHQPGHMIDLHNHLLPALDDGPATLEESVAVAIAAAADGVTTIVATPHLRADHPAVRTSELARRCTDLRQHLAERDVDIEIVTGGEVDIAWAQEASSEDLKLVSYAQRGTDLLLETPYGHLPGTFEGLLFNVMVRGFRVLLAHPERNPTFQTDPKRLANLVERGVLVQVTGSSLVAADGRSATGRLARWLVERELAHIVASDSHGEARRRVPLSAALSALTPMVGERARWMVTEAPAALLAGEALPEPPRRTSLWDEARRRWLRL